MKTKIFINSVDYSQYVVSISESKQFDEGYIIGNTPSSTLSLNVDNSSGAFNTLLDNQFILKQEQKQLGVFNVIEKPERMTSELSLSLNDNMVKTNILYNSNITYPCKIKDQLDEMKTLLGLNINYLDIPQSVLNKEVNFYDNTESIRMYLSWISEACACNVFADEKGNIKFAKLLREKSNSIESSDVESFDKIEEFVITKVKLDNGILFLSKGSDDGNTLAINKENPYIETQEQVNFLYEELHGISFYTMKGFKCASINGLALGNIVEYVGKFNFMALSIKTEFMNATYDIQEISGELNIKNAEYVINKPSTNVKIRRLKVISDQNEQSLQIIAKEQDGLNEKFAEFVIDVDSIKQEVKETTEKVESFETQTADLYYYLSTSCTSMVDGSWSTDPPTWVQGKYIWQKTKYTFANGTTKESNPVCLTGNSGQDGNDAILLYIDSSNGNIFKNSGVATTLTAIIIVAGLRLDTSQKLKDYFGEGANIIWKFKRLGETEFNPIDKSDPRLSDGGFIFTLNPDDVQTKHTFKCDLDY